MSRRRPKPRPAAPEPSATALPPLDSAAGYRLVFEARRRCLLGETDCDSGRSARALFAAWAGLDPDTTADLSTLAAPDVNAAWQRAWQRATRDLLCPQRVLR